VRAIVRLEDYMEILLVSNTAIAEAKQKEIEIKISNASKDTSVSSETTEEVTAASQEVISDATEKTEAVVTEETADTATEDEAAAEEALNSAEPVEGEAAAGEAVDGTVTETVPAEGEVITDEAVTDTVAVDGKVIIDDGSMPVYDGSTGMEEGAYVDPTMGMGTTEVKNPLLSSWLFVCGISAAVLFVSVVLGVLLARRKIKKGIELYED
jgi:hypothetical protein